jgi:hypothetical protein
LATLDKEEKGRARRIAVEEAIRRVAETREEIGEASQTSESRSSRSGNEGTAEQR